MTDPFTYRSIISPAQVLHAAFGSTGDQISEQVKTEQGPLYVSLSRLCRGVTARIERYLRRRLVPQSVRLRFRHIDWYVAYGYETGEDSLQMVAIPRQWPVVEITAVDEDVADIGNLSILDGTTEPGRRLAYDPAVIAERPWSIDAFVGYRRQEMTLIQLQEAVDPDDAGGGTPLSSLTVAPPVIPFDITDVAETLALRQWRQHARGLVGLTSVAQTVEGLTVASARVQQSDAQLLRRLFPYRYLIV